MGTVRSILTSVSVCAVAFASTAAIAQDATNNQSVFERQRSDYDAKGLPAGAFRILPTLKVEEEYNDNIFATDGNEQEDFITHVKPSLTIESDWSRHSLTAYANADAAFYADNGDEDNTDYTVGTTGRLDVLRETYIFGGASHALLHEDRGDPNATGSITEPTEYEQNNANISVYRGLRRFSVTADADYTEFDYEDDITTAGGINDNDDRDRYKAKTGLRLGYEILPDYEAFVQGNVNKIDYDDAINNGNNRDSDGYEVETGLALDLGGKTRGEVSVGFMEQKYDDPTLSDVDDFTYGASILWNPSQLTSVRLNADRTIEETVQTGASAYVNSTAGIAVEHELLRSVLVGANFNYSFHKYEGVNITREDDWYAAGADVKYLINRYSNFDLSYEFLDRDSNLANQDYTQNRVMAGLAIKF